MWTAEAADNLDAIVSYIELFNPSAASRMAERLIALADSLAEFPERGRDAGEGRRELTVVPPYSQWRLCRVQAKLPTSYNRFFGKSHAQRYNCDRPER